MQHPPKPNASLNDWLDYAMSIHTSAIDMGLERVRDVFIKLGLGYLGDSDNKNRPLVFMAAGTNGKGSTTATLARIAMQTGQRVALYQSPHLLAFNERIVLDGAPVDDSTLVDALHKVETVRQKTGLSLSFFEMVTLAAFVIFDAQDAGVWVLEVGLGGRLDVVNLVYADVAIITNIGLDHTDWLGSDLEAIGREKAGIIKANACAILGRDLPPSVHAFACQYAKRIYTLGTDFVLEDNLYQSTSGQIALGQFTLFEDNVALAIAAALSSTLSLKAADISAGVQAAHLAGRFDRRKKAGVYYVFDVAHNPHGAQHLMRQFVPFWCSHRIQYPSAQLHLLISMLADKDMYAVVDILDALEIDAVHTAPLDNHRSRSLTNLQAHLARFDVVYTHADIPQALANVQADAGDVVLVMGSFYTVAEAMIALDGLNVV